MVTYNTRKNFISKEFKQYVNTMGINIKGVLVKAHNSINMVEQYHKLLQYIYQIITVKIPNIDKDITL